MRLRAAGIPAVRALHSHAVARPLAPAALTILVGNALDPYTRLRAAETSVGRAQGYAPNSPSTPSSHRYFQIPFVGQVHKI